MSLVLASQPRLYANPKTMDPNNAKSIRTNGASKNHKPVTEVMITNVPKRKMIQPSTNVSPALG